MTIKLLEADYYEMKQSVEALSWVWQKYELECPNDWYLFKYENRVRLFLETDESETLFQNVKQSFGRRKVKLGKEQYSRLRELSRISQELQDVLETPPYGSHLPSDLQQATALILKNKHKIS